MDFADWIMFVLSVTVLMLRNPSLRFFPDNYASFQDLSIDDDLIRSMNLIKR